MPRKFIVARKTRRHPRRTRFPMSKANTTRNVRNSGNPFLSNRITTTMKYHEDLSRSSVIGAFTHQFRANSLFKPDFSASGHQPRGFDQLKTIYTDYRVYACQAELICMVNNTSVPSVPMIAAISWHSTNVNNVITIGDVFENRQVKSKTFNRDNPLTLRKFLTVAQILGESKRFVRNEKDLASGTGNNPLKDAFINIYVGALDGGSTFSVDVSLTLTYYCMMYGSIQVPQS